MDMLRRTVALLAWGGLALLLGIIQIQPAFRDCAAHAQVLSTTTDFSYFPWQGCQIEIEPGTWMSWNELQVRAPQLLDRPACEDRGRTRCV